MNFIGHILANRLQKVDGLLQRVEHVVCGIDSLSDVGQRHHDFLEAIEVSLLHLHLHAFVRHLNEIGQFIQAVNK